MLGFAQLISVIAVTVLFKYRWDTIIILLVFVITLFLFSVFTLILVKVLVILFCAFVMSISFFLLDLY